MKFSVFKPTLPDPSESVPAMYWLSGLTCTDDNFVTKASNAFKTAQEKRIALVMPDTSPRGEPVEGDRENWDLGVGAGFYVDATEKKWKEGGEG